MRRDKQLECLGCCDREEGEREQKVYFPLCFRRKKSEPSAAQQLLKHAERTRTRPAHPYRRELGAVLCR